MEVERLAKFTAICGLSLAPGTSYLNQTPAGMVKFILAGRDRFRLFDVRARESESPRGRFLKIIPIGITKTGFSRADVSMETGFHAGIGRNADWNNL